jgi:hypothetical protein
MLTKLNARVHARIYSILPISATIKELVAAYYKGAHLTTLHRIYLDIIYALSDALYVD